MLVVGTINGGFYKLCLVVHIFCAIVGFGAVYLNAIYSAEARKRRGPDGLAVYEANFRVSQIGQYFIYAVFVFGFALVGLSDEAWEFSQTWIWLSTLFFVVGVGMSHGMLLPAVKRMGVLMREMVAAGPPPAGVVGPPPRAAEMAELSKRVGATSAFLNVLVVVILFLMVWKPGV